MIFAFFLRMMTSPIFPNIGQILCGGRSLTPSDSGFKMIFRFFSRVMRPATNFTKKSFENLRIYSTHLNKQKFTSFMKFRIIFSWTYGISSKSLSNSPQKTAQFYIAQTQILYLSIGIKSPESSVHHLQSDQH